jgi:hypothetical protein
LSPVALILVSALVLAGCQKHSIGVILNGSDDDIVISLVGNKQSNEFGKLICTTRQDRILRSTKTFRRPGSIGMNQNWQVTDDYQSDEASCSVSGLRLKPGEAAIVDSNPPCKGFLEDIQRRGLDAKDYTPPYARISIQGRRGSFSLSGWPATARFKPAKSDVCVLEVKNRDLRS